MGNGTLCERADSAKTTIGEVLRNLKNAKRYAFDIGSSIVKVAYCSSVPSHAAAADRNKKHNIADESFRLHFIQFHISNFKQCLEYIREECSFKGIDSTACTGSNIDAYQQLISEMLSTTCVKLNEMECLVKGNNFLLRNVLDESFVYNHKSEACNYVFQTIDLSTTFPYLMVNISTGVSIYKVESDDKFERVGGSSIGGGTFHGLGNLLAHCNDFTELMNLAESGDHRNVDVLVADMQGAMLESFCLSDDLIAGSFGKCEDTTKLSKVDLMRSLLLMISNSIGQISVLYAQRCNAKSIFFGGYFVRNHAIAMRTISYAVNYWSQGKMSARFLRHEGYTAAVGAFIKQNENIAAATLHPSPLDHCHEMSWKEHYAGCSALGRFVPTAPLSSKFEAGTLEMECCNMKLQSFPLLSSYEDYIPDTVNLNDDVEARDYWISCMENSVEKTLIKALESDRDSPDAQQRGNLFKDRYLTHLKILKDKSFAYGCCNVRNLLDLREQILNEQLFDDAFFFQKTLENEIAIKEFPAVIGLVDSIDDFRERQLMVAKGILAGNVFDWGAKESVKMMESHSGLSFSEALKLIPARPWLVDELDKWLNTISSKTYRCAAIFVDNSGGDVILGVLPFVRELLKMGTKVIIVCNWTPALNDITYRELVALMPAICSYDPIFGQAFEEGRVQVAHSGQGSPCLDLRRVNSQLCEQIRNEGVDLVVVEGMGRALHTNYNAEFGCDSLKVAVIKTKWLADRLGGAIFSTIFKFRQGSIRIKHSDTA